MRVKRRLGGGAGLAWSVPRHRPPLSRGLILGLAREGADAEEECDVDAAVDVALLELVVTSTME